MRSSIVVLASVIGLAIAQSPSDCTDYESARDCVLALSDEEASCQTVLAIKQCYDDYCPEVPFPSELNSIVDTCENGGTFPGSGSGSGTGTGSETATGTGTGSQSTSTSSSGSSSGGTCTDRQAYADCVNPLAKLEQTCDVVLEIADCFNNYCPERAYQIEEDVAACSASSTKSGSSSGSTRTSSADDSEATESGIPGGSGSTRTTSGADSTGTGLGSGSDGNSTIISDPTNTSSNGDGPVSTDSPSNEGAADRLFASAGAIIGSLVAVMAWL
ncbi:hypothetical protein V500_02135 [Pseudogymnoascus sp. VKM F-4518 (FW-2643)]|nr:hypothetical protein V500_02135 [Pseudogymnoascus sp. VKM F-4518 (FW-2643)]